MRTTSAILFWAFAFYASVSGAEYCGGLTYYSPNADMCLPLKSLGSYCNAVQKCAPPLTCTDQEVCVNSCDAERPIVQPPAVDARLSAETPFVDTASHLYTIEKLELCPGSAAPGTYQRCDQRTHEVTYDPVNRRVYVTQMRMSSLLRFDMDFEGRIGPDYVRLDGIGSDGNRSAIHWVQMSAHYPGLAWITLQNSQEVFLIDPEDDYRVVKHLKVPNTMTDPNNASRLVHIWSPHSMCEGPDGTIVVNLQNSPEIGSTDDTYIQDRSKYYNLEGNRLYYAVWHVHPDKYNDTDLPQKGGVIYEAMKQPVNCAMDGSDRVLVAQDNSASVLVLTENGPKQIPVQLPATGPGMVASPEGSVWAACIAVEPPLVGYMSKVIRFRPGDDTPYYYELYQSSLTEWGFANSRRVIHFAFHPIKPIMYSLTTALFAGVATEDIIVNYFEVHANGTWGDIIRNKTEVIAIGSYHAAHRIIFVQDPSRSSLVVTNWMTDEVLQVFDGKDNFFL